MEATVTHFLATLLANHLGDESSFVEVRHDPVFLLWASFGICQSAKVWHCPRSHATYWTANNCNATRSHLSQHLLMLPSNRNLACSCLQLHHCHWIVYTCLCIGMGYQSSAGLWAMQLALCSYGFSFVPSRDEKKRVREPRDNTAV